LSRSESRAHKELRAAATATAEAFEFLENDFCYRVVDSRITGEGFMVDIGGTNVGVRIVYQVRDPLGVFVCLLKDGVFPGPWGDIRADSVIAQFDLLDIEVESGLAIQPEDEALYAIPDRKDLDTLAARLRQAGSGILAGDLSLVPALQRRVLERARIAALEEWGDDVHEHGW
jgi:hypothetical protein